MGQPNYYIFPDSNVTLSNKLEKNQYNDRTRLHVLFLFPTCYGNAFNKLLLQENK